MLQHVKPATLELLYDTLPKHCGATQCTLHDTPRLVMSYGNANADVMFVGEAPGTAEHCSLIPIAGGKEVLETPCAQCASFKECFRTLL